MKSVSILLVITFAAAVLSFHTVNAQDGGKAVQDPLLIYRNETGRLSDNARQNQALLQRAAKANGFVELWLYLDSDAIFGPGMVTEDQYRQACVRVVERLVDQGRVWHPTNGPWNDRDICFIRANASAVPALIRDKRVKQIMGSTHLH